MSLNSSKLPNSMAFFFSVIFFDTCLDLGALGLLWDFTCLPSPSTLNILLCLLCSFALWMVTSLEFTAGLFPPSLWTFPGEALAHLLILCWWISSPHSVPATLRAAGLDISLSEAHLRKMSAATSNWVGTHADGWLFLSNLSSVFLNKENSLSSPDRNLRVILQCSLS